MDADDRRWRSEQAAWLWQGPSVSAFTRQRKVNARVLLFLHDRNMNSHGLTKYLLVDLSGWVQKHHE